MGSFKMTRPRQAGKTSLAEEWVAAHEAAGHEVTRVTVYADDFDSGPGPDEDLPTSADIERARTGKPEYTIPEKPYDQLLWRAYVHGAGWSETIEHADYPDWDDVTYYLGTNHGRAMLEDFYELLAEFKPAGVDARTTCPVGRPYRDHARPCHPECDWSAS